MLFYTEDGGDYGTRNVVLFEAYREPLATEEHLRPVHLFLDARCRNNL